MEPRQRLGFSPAEFRSPGEGLAWLGGLILALSSFMSWYSFDPDVGFTVSITGWHTGILGKLIFFLGLGVLGFLALRASGVELPPSVPGGMVFAGLGFVATSGSSPFRTTFRRPGAASASGSAFWRACS